METSESVDYYENDESHPISNVSTIDVEVRLASGGRYLGILIEMPLRDDLKSQRRLIRKIENYINDLYSDVAVNEVEIPSGKHNLILLHLHPDSDSIIFDLAEKCKLWVEECGVDFKIEIQEKGVMNNFPD